MIYMKEESSEIYDTDVVASGKSAGYSNPLPIYNEDALVEALNLDQTKLKNEVKRNAKEYSKKVYYTEKHGKQSCQVQATGRGDSRKLKDLVDPHKVLYDNSVDILEKYSSSKSGSDKNLVEKKEKFSEETKHKLKRTCEKVEVTGIEKNDHKAKNLVVDIRNKKVDAAEIKCSAYFEEINKNAYFEETNKNAYFKEINKNALKTTLVSRGNDSYYTTSTDTSKDVCNKTNINDKLLEKSKNKRNFDSENLDYLNIASGYVDNENFELENIASENLPIQNLDSENFGIGHLGKEYLDSENLGNENLGIDYIENENLPNQSLATTSFSSEKLDYKNLDYNSSLRLKNSIQSKQTKQLKHYKTFNGSTEYSTNSKSSKVNISQKNNIMFTKDNFAHTKDYFTDTKDNFTHTKNNFAHFKDNSIHTKDNFMHFKDNFTHLKDSSTYTKDSPTHIKDNFTHTNDNFSKSNFTNTNDNSHIKNNFTYTKRYTYKDETLSKNNMDTKGNISHTKESCTHTKDSCTHSKDPSTHIKECNCDFDLENRTRKLCINNQEKIKSVHPDTRFDTHECSKCSDHCIQCSHKHVKKRTKFTDSDFTNQYDRQFCNTCSEMLKPKCSRHVNLYQVIPLTKGKCSHSIMKLTEVIDYANKINDKNKECGNKKLHRTL